MGYKSNENKWLGWSDPLLRQSVGGTISEITGGKFANGAKTMAFMHLLKEAPGLYKRIVRYELDINPGGPAVDKGPLGRPVKGANNVGIQDRWRYDEMKQRIVGFFEEGGPVSRFLNRIPGVNAVAGMHDVQQVSVGEGIWRKVLNVPGMPLAAGVTYAGFVGEALNRVPDFLYVPIQVNDDDSKSKYMWVPAGGY